MPQLDFFTILNQFFILLMIFIPAVMLFKIIIYPTLDLFLRTRIYRYNTIIKANKTYLLLMLNMFFKIYIKNINIKKFANYIIQLYQQIKKK
jgi:hypothetical protein